MFCKYVVVELNIFCLYTPFSIEILSERGEFLKRVKISLNCSKICVRTSGKFIRLIARQGNLSEYKTIFLNDNGCQSVFVSFAFNSAFSRNSFGLVFLKDANYGFPVENAILNFKSL